MKHLSSEEEYEALLSEMLGGKSIDSDAISDIFSNAFGSEIGASKSEDSDVYKIDYSELFKDIDKASEDQSIEHLENVTICLDIGDASDYFEIPISSHDEKKSYTRRSVLNIKDAPPDKTQIPIPKGVKVVTSSRQNELIYSDEAPA